MDSNQRPLENIRALVRMQAKQLVRNPDDTSTLLARLQATQHLTGSEPVQGALADLFVALGTGDATTKGEALQQVRSRLAPHVARWFAAQVESGPLPRTSPLATRWSIVARQSADISTRARRCSVDDSRALAQLVIESIGRGDGVEQSAFLHHCVTCRDNLAFMLVRRAMLRIHADLPQYWQEVSLQLENLSNPL